jgi:lipopolysaccharide/colanic/teichoic acid biosynthesis glycosyltransferase
MVEDAEKCGPALACENDPRVTRVGRLFRKMRIDEIPQFLNVLRGEMSIIGPRPERSFYINQVRGEVPEFTIRLSVKPGITGLAQVENGYTQTIERMKEKLFYDLKYINEISAFQEIKILIKTVYVVATGKGAC